MNDEIGDRGDVVISSRIRLARNIADFPFVSTCSDLHRREIETTVRAAWTQVQVQQPVRLANASELETLDRQFLLDLQKVQRSVHSEINVEPAETELGSEPESEVRQLDAALVLATQAPMGPDSDKACLTINEEDHVRITVTRNDFDLKLAWEQISHLDDLFEQYLDYAFSPKWGYLTASPANVGTGMRVSVLLHLPALVKMGHVEKAFRSFQRMNVVARGVFGELATGDFFRVTNQATLGKKESELVEQVALVVPSLVKFERQAREFLLKENRDGLQREVSESLERLCRFDLDDESEAGNAEVLSLLSKVRMGTGMGLVTPTDIARVQGKFVMVQLRHQLLAAIAREDYDDATRLRDWIHQLETDGWQEEGPL